MMPSPEQWHATEVAMQDVPGFDYDQFATHDVELTAAVTLRHATWTAVAVYITRLPCDFRRPQLRRVGAYGATAEEALQALQALLAEPWTGWHRPGAYAGRRSRR